MPIENVLSQTIDDIPDCVAAGLVDLASGTLLSVKTVETHPPEVLNMVSAATSDLFRGPNVVVLEKMFKSLGDEQKNDDDHYFQEFIVLSKNLIHVFIRGRMFDDQVLVIVARASTNIGLVLNQARRRLDAVETATIKLPPDRE